MSAAVSCFGASGTVLSGKPLPPPPMHSFIRTSLVAQWWNPPANAGTSGDTVQSLGWEDPLAEEMAMHCSILSWEIPWLEEPGQLQSTGLHRVGQD